MFLAHLMLDAQRATLFVGAGKIDPTLATRLQQDGIALADYAAAAEALRTLPPGATLLIDPRRLTLGFRQRVSDGVHVVEAINPSTLFKSRKSEDEARHIREAMALIGRRTVPARDDDHSD